MTIKAERTAAVVVACVCLIATTIFIGASFLVHWWYFPFVPVWAAGACVAIAHAEKLDAYLEGGAAHE